MELKNLRTFQAIVDRGSYQRAAEALGYTQSTVTIHIQQLEEELGLPLFQRTGRRMVLTQMGERFLPQTRELLLAADRLAQIGQEGREPSGVLRVDMAETLLCYQVQPVIQKFRRLEDYLRKRDITLDATLELWSIETIKRCVMSDLGFTYLPRFAAREELGRGLLLELESPVSGVRFPALCARHKRRWVTPAMELFMDLLRENLRGE